ncbi:ATP-binding protein [Desulfonatronum thioautotrophicum]|uniref:ATP-binding protein n=1 Tax=Desulfonatronum thioautotrophicum TaxID=617001 RepID=UPI00069C7641|nr:ATP-binding protein [Desulfonatronum thioautotrophicum]
MQIVSLSDHDLHMRFPSTLENVDQASLLAQDFLREHLPNTDFFLVLLSLREALTNAVIHGNRKEALKAVDCHISLSADRLDIVVSDQGAGFPWRSRKWELPPPSSVSGRGLEIMRNSFDRIAFNQCGNQVTLQKRLNTSGVNTMLQIQHEGSKIVARVTENMVGSRIDGLRDALNDLINGGHTDVTIDLQGVDMVDSLGMGLLVATHNSLKAKQGRLSVVNVHPEIYNVLTTMRLDKHFTITRAT